MKVMRKSMFSLSDFPLAETIKDYGGDIDFDTTSIELWEGIGFGGSGSHVNRCTVNGLSCAVKVHYPFFSPLILSC
jgi:hypothetical protein